VQTLGYKNKKSKDVAQRPRRHVPTTSNNQSNKGCCASNRIQPDTDMVTRALMMMAMVMTMGWKDGMIDGIF
jgi:hypothetical protein